MNRTVALALGWIAIVWSASFLFARMPAEQGSPRSTSQNPLERWDATFYKGLAEHAAVERKDAFFPLFPLVVRTGMTATKTSFETFSALLNTVLTLVDALLFSFLITKYAHHDHRTNAWALAAFLALPASFSLLAPYPVAFFVFFALLSWYGSASSHPALAVGAACLAFFTHPVGIVLILLSGMSFFTRRWTIEKTAAAIVLAASATVLIASGLLSSFLGARQGFTSFQEIHFWQQGIWYLTNHVSLATGLTVILGTFLAASLAIVSLVKDSSLGWRLTVPTAGYFLLTVSSGLWTGMPRFMLPAFLLPLAVARFRPSVRLTVILISAVLEFAWLYGFVSWKTYV